MVQPLIIPIRHRDSESYQVFSEWGFWHKGKHFTVEEGFICDGASVPRLLWPWMPPDGLHRAAALPHDRIFASGGRMNYRTNFGVVTGYQFTLWEADLLFLKQMIDAGVNPARAKITWLALKTGSWYSWHASRNRSPEILPVRNAAPETHRKPKSRFSRHLYATTLTP